MPETSKETPQPPASDSPTPPFGKASVRPQEVGGPAGLEPTRYGDWEKNGRCIDF